MRALRNNGAALAFLGLMLVCLVLQAFAGHAEEAQELRQHGQPAQSVLAYVASWSYGVDVLENWQSEFLQFALFILATIWLVQRGSSQTKQPGEEGFDDAPRSSFVRQHSLLLVMTALFVLTWCGQAATGWRAFNDEQAQHELPSVSFAGYLVEPEFWSRTLQNWQSELLAVGAMSIFTVYLRERGSSESKHVDAPDAAAEPTY